MWKFLVIVSLFPGLGTVVKSWQEKESVLAIYTKEKRAKQKQKQKVNKLNKTKQLVEFLKPLGNLFQNLI